MISSSYIKRLLLYACLKKSIHVVTNTNHIHLAAEQLFQFGLHEVERNQGWNSSLVTNIHIAVRGLFSTCYRTEYPNARQSVLAFGLWLVKAQQV